MGRVAERGAGAGGPRQECSLCGHGCLGERRQASDAADGCRRLVALRRRRDDFYECGEREFGAIEGGECVRETSRERLGAT